MKVKILEQDECPYKKQAWCKFAFVLSHEDTTRNQVLSRQKTDSRQSDGRQPDSIQQTTEKTDSRQLTEDSRQQTAETAGRQQTVETVGSRQTADR